MKARLMYRDRDLDLDAPPPAGADDLVRDLGLDTVTQTMSGGDPFLHRVVTQALLASLIEPAEITYRQRVLDDCLRRPEVARDLYGLAGEALAGEKKIWGGFLRDTPEMSLSHSVQVLEHYLVMLRRLREFAEQHRPAVRSEALAGVFDTVAAELSDEYFDVLKDHLRQLRFPSGIQLSAQLGQGVRGTGYVLRRQAEGRSWWARLLSLPDPNALTFTIPERDEAGWQAVRSLRDEGLAQVARALAESTDHLHAFFTTLCREIGFYVGCLNLHERLTSIGQPVCVPEPLQPGTATLACRGLSELGLSLRQQARVVGNDVTAESVRLIVVTGANQGGKSTFLRSLGIAQLMMQSGMFVAAQSFTATAYRGIFTHYRREEDASMTSGKLEEELARMSAVLDALGPGALVLSNESFASTNEREGSQIGRHVIGSLVRAGVTVVAVTHLFDLARSLYDQQPEGVFLRAERRDDGARTYRLLPGVPLSTSFGRDLYRQIFGAPVARERP